VLKLKERLERDTVLQRIGETVQKGVPLLSGVIAGALSKVQSWHWVLPLLLTDFKQDLKKNENNVELDGLKIGNVKKQQNCCA
jgi:hypothetical protein